MTHPTPTAPAKCPKCGHEADGAKYTEASLREIVNEQRLKLRTALARVEVLEKQVKELKRGRRRI